jgi:hypothetical protein
MSSEKKTPKIGAGHAKAFMRQGLDELRNALYPESPIAQRHVEMGLYGTVTPAEVGQQRQADPEKSDPADSILHRHDYGRQHQPERDQRDIERE